MKKKIIKHDLNKEDKIKKELLIPATAKEVKKKFGHFLNKETIIPVQHRFKRNLKHSIRCFRKIYERNEEGEKLTDLPKKRCGHPAMQGYLYCRFHGGHKESAIVHNKEGMPVTRMAIKEYKGIYEDSIGSVLEKFVNDPDILDLKPDLANLKTILWNYVKELSRDVEPDTKLSCVSRITTQIMNEEISDYEKYDKIEKIILDQQKLTDGANVDRINRCIKNIADVSKIIHSIEVKKDFQLTPAGFKRFIRTLVEIHKKVIKNEDELSELQRLLMEQSVETTAKQSENGSES